MEHKLPIISEDRAVLAKARQIYGSTNQMLVVIEELGELAKVCCKYPRYASEKTAQEQLHNQAVDEVADVLIVLDHVFALFDLDWEEVTKRIPIKIERVARWINDSTDFEQTTRDRELHEKSECSGCIFESAKGKAGRCKTCKDQSGYVAKPDCDSCEHINSFLNLAPGGVCYQCVTSGGSKYTPR